MVYTIQEIRKLPKPLRKRWYFILTLASIVLFFSLGDFTSVITQRSWLIGVGQSISGILLFAAVVRPTKKSNLVIFISLVFDLISMGLIGLLASIFVGPFAVLVAPEPVLTIITWILFSRWWKAVSAYSPAL